MNILSNCKLSFKDKSMLTYLSCLVNCIHSCIPPNKRECRGVARSYFLHNKFATLKVHYLVDCYSYWAGLCVVVPATYQHTRQQ